MKSYITRQFKKFMNNTNAKGFDKDRKQSSLSQFKSQDKGKKDARDGDQYTIPSGPKCFGCQGFRHIKQECPTYLKTIRKSKALATTLSDIEPEDDSDNEDDEILNAFTATVNPTEGIVEDVDEEEKLVKSKFEKMDKQVTSTQPMQSYTRSQKSMRSCIGWPPRNLVMWSLSEKQSLQSLMKQIKLLEY